MGRKENSRNFKIHISMQEQDKKGLEELHIIEPNDNWLEKHIKNTSKDISISFIISRE